MSDIFLSYKREEQSAARSLADALERQGWSVWWDPQLRAGERFDDIIERALQEARCVIVVWSKLSVTSKYVRDEATYALNRDKLVPVAIDDVSLPFRFEGLHTARLLDWSGSDSSPGFKSLLRDLMSVLERPPRPNNEAAAKGNNRVVESQQLEPAIEGDERARADAELASRTVDVLNDTTVPSTTSRPVEFLLDWIAVQNSAGSWFWLVWGTGAILYSAVSAMRHGRAVVPITTYMIGLALVIGQGMLLRWVAGGIVLRRRARLLLGGVISLGGALEWGVFASTSSGQASAGMMWTWSLVGALNGLLLLGAGLFRAGRYRASEER